MNIIHVVPVSRRRKDQQEKNLRQVQPCCSPSVSFRTYICRNMFLTSFPWHICLSKSLSSLSLDSTFAWWFICSFFSQTGVVNNFEMWCDPHGEAMCEVWCGVSCDAAKAKAKVSKLEVSQPNFLFMIPRLQMENMNCMYIMLMNHRKSQPPVVQPSHQHHNRSFPSWGLQKGQCPSPWPQRA